MATWKKIAISGSDISQFNNNLNYIKNGDGGVILTGSFSGSFVGTTDLPNLTDGFGIADFIYDGATTASIAIQVSGSTLEVGTNGIRVANNGITATQLSNSVAGNGLSGGGGTALAVNVDGSSIEINADSLRVKALGITNAMLVNSGSIIGSTPVNLGSTVTSIAGLNLTSTTATGSFTGSFAGDGSGLTGVTASTLANSLTDGDGINAFTYDGSSSKQITVKADSTTGGNIKPVSVSANGVGLDVDSIKGTGLSANSGLLNVNYGSLDDTAVEGSTTITVNGTNNAISITGNSSQALGGGPSYTIDLSDTIDGSRTFTNDVLISGNLTVEGTASFQNTQNLVVADRFVLFASGSTTAGDGGIIIQQGTQDIGELFGFDSGTTRWAVTSSFNASTSAFIPDAFMATAIVGAGTVPTAAPARYTAKGNIFVGTDEGIWIYS